MKIAIASGKGGTGKTTLATNLASYLAETGPVILVDLDVEEPNSGLFIHGRELAAETRYSLVPEWDADRCSFCGLCQTICNFNAIVDLGDRIMLFPELCHSCHACSELCPDEALPMKSRRIGRLRYIQAERLDFVESRLDIGQEQAVPLINQTLDFVGGRFRNGTLQLLDSPPGTACPAIAATRTADHVILVTEPTPFGLHDLKLAVATMQALDQPFSVVINRGGQTDNMIADYCKQQAIPVLAGFANDRRVAELYSRGRLIYDQLPEFKQQLAKIATFVTSQEGIKA